MVMMPEAPLSNFVSCFHFQSSFYNIGALSFPFMNMSECLHRYLEYRKCWTPGAVANVVVGHPVRVLRVRLKSPGRAAGAWLSLHPLKHVYF